MNAIETNLYTEAWRRIGEQLGKPRAILSISAHWYVSATALTAGPQPRTIHDFGGFPRELYQVQYPAPGDPDLARRIQAMLAPLPVTLDNAWGRRGWTCATLAALSEAELKAALEMAWRHAAPKAKARKRR